MQEIVDFTGGVCSRQSKYFVWNS